MQNKTALITGATGDIGQAIARSLAQAGWQLVLHYHSNEKAAEALAAELKAVTVQGDLSQRGVATEVVGAALDAYGRLDALINNAGITRDGMLIKMSDDDFQTVLDANLYSAWAMAKAAARPMLKQRSGTILAMSSVVGLSGNVAQSNYAASKAGLIGLTKSLARELAPRGITANAIAPGFIETKMTAGLSDEWKEALFQQIPLGRFGQAEDVAACAAFLVSDQARYITGQVVSVDGGMRI